LPSGIVDPLFGGEPNLSTAQRAIYIALGLGMAAAGAQPRPNPLLNFLALTGGSYLAWSAYQGRCPVKAALFDRQKELSTLSPGLRGACSQKQCQLIFRETYLGQRVGIGVSVVGQFRAASERFLRMNQGQNEARRDKPYQPSARSLRSDSGARRRVHPAGRKMRLHKRRH